MKVLAIALWVGLKGTQTSLLIFDLAPLNLQMNALSEHPLIPTESFIIS